MKNARTLSAATVTMVLLAFPASGQSFGDTQFLDHVFEPNAEMAFGDLDGDGTLDLLWSTPLPARLRWHRGLRDGAFEPARDLIYDDLLTSSSSISIGDVDGDGDMDIVAGNEQTANFLAIRTFENLGGGRFAPPQSVIGTPSSVSNASLVDLDDDGMIDLLFFSGNSGVYWCRNLGFMLFEPASLVMPTSDLVNQMLAADLEGDGDQDVFVRAQAEDAIYVVENLGGGAFGPGMVATAQFQTPQDLDVADLDGDGMADLVCFGASNQVGWCENLGSGQFAPPINFSALPGSLPLAISAGDLDGDGDSDVTVSWDAANGLTWFENLGAGQFGGAQSIPSPVQVTDRNFLIDLDGDGDLDPVVTSDDANNPGAQWAENQGAGSFVGLSPLTASTRDLGGFEFADLDGAHGVDLIAVDRSTDEFVVFLNAGNGTFSTRATIATGRTGVFDVKAGDLDADGDVDMVSAAYYGPFGSSTTSVEWHENTGSGTFAPPVTILVDTLADSWMNFTLQDSDGDGDLDVLTQYKIRNSVTGSRMNARWVRNNGSGSFTPLSPRVLGQGLSEVAVAIDLDGDSDLDLVTSEPSSFGAFLYFHESTGGSLGPYQYIETLDDLRVYLAVTDFDGDGIQDVLALDGYSIKILLGGRGPGGIGLGSASDLVPVGAAVNALDLLDLDADGDDDIVVHSAAAARWYENLGGGPVGPGQAITGWSPRFFDSQVGAVDFDGDTDVDLYRDILTVLAIQENEERFGHRYCLPATANSSGRPANTTAGGSPSISANDFTLFASDLPPDQFGFFFVGDAPGLVASPGGAQGNLCVGGQIGRIARSQGEIFLASSNGAASVPLDLTSVPTPTGSEAAMAGDTRYFQSWFRDVNPMATSNFASALRVVFRP